MTEIKKFLSSILAGIFISLGGAIYITVGGVVGAVMFAFGLLCVVHYKTLLFTGKSGFVKTYSEILELFFIILLGNIFGCALASIIIDVDANSIIEIRNSTSYLECFTRAIGCGFIMTTIVKAAKDGNIIPIFFGVPIFILLGFYHCIADAFYFCVSDIKINFLKYLIIVAGNFVGCNVPRLLLLKKDI